MTYGDTNPGQSRCKKCTSDYHSAHRKRKSTEATSAAAKAGREVNATGRLSTRPLDHRYIKLVVQAVCQSRPTPTSKIPWAAVMEKLQGWDFPSYFTQAQVTDSWKHNTGKPASVTVYENSPQATANENRGDWITGVCSGCDNNQSMYFSQLAKRQTCRECNHRIKFTRKDETVEGNE